MAPNCNGYDLVGDRNDRGGRTFREAACETPQRAHSRAIVTCARDTGMRRGKIYFRNVGETQISGRAKRELAEPQAEPAFRLSEVTASVQIEPLLRLA